MDLHVLSSHVDLGYHRICALDRRLDGPQSHSGPNGEEKNSHLVYLLYNKENIKLLFFNFPHILVQTTVNI
jgi:hypothetical protein